MTSSTVMVFNLWSAWKAASSVGKNAIAKSDTTSLVRLLILKRSQPICDITATNFEWPILRTLRMKRDGFFICLGSVIISFWPWNVI